MGTGSYIVRGKGNSESWQLKPQDGKKGTAFNANTIHSMTNAALYHSNIH